MTIKLIKSIFILPLLIGFIYLGWINKSMYYKGAIQEGKTGQFYDSDVIAQLEWLGKEIHENNAAEEMQSIYPEGLVFIHALYGLAWCNQMEAMESSADLFAKGMKQVELSLAVLFSEEGRYYFSEDLKLPFGAFYNGWSNYLLGRKLALQNPRDRNQTEVDLFKGNTERIADVLLGNLPNPYLESYTNEVWPADLMACMKSLQIAQELDFANYDVLMKKWLGAIKNKLDKNGLIPHKVEVLSGEPKEESRGSSQSLILCFLGDLDDSFAKSQFEIYENLFLDYRFGLPGIREHAKGEIGAGDIDSGPVIFGIGGSGSIVGISTMKTYENHSIASGLSASVEGFGLPINCGNEKYFLGGVLPMADVFIAWARSKSISDNTHYSPWGFHLRSLLCCLLVFLIYYVARGPKKKG